MAKVSKIDSNATGLRYAEESSLGTLPGTPDWIQLEPNSYNDFGGQIATVARNPINDGRQRKKGVVTDLDAAGGFNTDLTQENLRDLLQGFFFADIRDKGEEEPTAVDGVAEEYDVADTTGFVVGTLIFASGFTNSENNGLKTVNTVTSNTSVTVDEDLVAEASPPSGAKIVNVGHEFPTDDLEIDASGDLPKLVTTTTDLTTLGWVPGEFVFIGGDATANKFTNAANNGWARVKSVSANEAVLDKTAGTMVTETTTSVDMRVFHGRVLKNESDSSLITRRSYNLERTLGAPDDSSPSDIQSEYLVGAVPNQLTLNMETADKITADLSFVAIDHEPTTATTGLKSGNRPSLTEADAFNTSSDFSRLSMVVIDPTDSNPTSLFAYLESFSIEINNNLSPNKAISVLGAFEITAGQFQVGGSATAYFSDVAAMNAVRNNSDVTLDFAIVKDRTVDSNTIKSGISLDMPLITLGDGRADVQQDEAIKLPLEKQAAADATFNHTLLMSFYDYLPDAADT